MRITPLDIRKQEFRKTMRGLDADEVYAFLNTVAEEYETVLSDNKRLREHIVQLEERLKEYKNIEMNLRNTLLTAEKVTAEAKENARREAGLIVREAEVDAEKAAEAIRAHTMQLRREVLELKKQKDNYLTRLRTLLDSHYKVLEGFAEDFSHVDMEIEKIGKQVEEDTKKPLKTPRMSREKITEEYAGGPKDKVTWGEERRREDESRPAFPHPGAEKDKPAESQATGMPDHTSAPAVAEPRYTPPTGDIVPETKFPFTQPEDTRESTTGGEGAAISRLDTEPIGSFSETEGIEAREDGEHSGIEQLTMTEIPESGHRDDMNAPTDVQMGGTQTDTSEAPGGAEHSDHWKRYEVQGEKPDWKDYEIRSSAQPSTQPPAQSPGQPAAGSQAHSPSQPPVTQTPSQHPARDVEGPSDHEVEEALSSLTDNAAGVRDEMTGKETTGPDVQREYPAGQGETPFPGAASPETAEHVKTDATDPNAASNGPPAPSQETGAGEKSGAPWSMEELKKNLTNFGQDT